MKDSREKELDQEYEELLQELRVTIPGVEVLFAFLLILPFSNSFSQVSGVERGVYLSCFIFAAVSSILLIAPSAFHRLRWRQHDKEAVLRISNRLAVAGTVSLALAISAAVYLVTSFVYQTTLAALTTGFVAALICIIWYAMPLRRAHKQS